MDAKPPRCYLTSMSQVDSTNVSATLSQWVLADGLELVCDLSASSGAYLHDSKTGKDFLDFFGFHASRPLSFNHPRLSSPAARERLARAAVHKPSNGDVYTVEYARFVDLFAKVPLGGEFAHLFFVEGGGVAVDNALKAAFDWKHRKNAAAGRGDRGSQIISFTRAFHGRTGYALSVTDSADERKLLHFPRFAWPKVTSPVLCFPCDDDARARAAALERQALRELDEAFAASPDDIAAIIIEPIQGEGGDNYFSGEFLRALREVCSARECLLIFDEIQTGFGATGKWWDWQHHGVKPDLLCFGKKAQVCGFAATTRLDEVDSVFKVPSRISSTCSGNFTDMARATLVIEAIIEDELLRNAEEMGGYLLRLLREQAEAWPALGNVRGRGLWAAFDVATTADRDALLCACFEEALLVFPCGARGVRWRPALDIDADAIARAAAALEAALGRIYGKGLAR